MISIEPPKRVLVVRLSAIGDVVFASPLIESVKRTWPDAEVSWLVEPVAAPLLQSHPGLKEVILWRKADWKKLWKARRWRELWRTVTAFKRELKAREFDLVIDVQGLIKSAILARWTGASLRIGLDSGEFTKPFLHKVLPKSSKIERIGSEYLGIANDLGLDTSAFDMCVALSEDDERTAADVRAEGEYLVVCPFTTRPQKHWVDVHWRMLLERLVARGERVIVLGGPADQGVSPDATVEGVESLVGKMSLIKSAAVISQAKGLIGVDTGLTHMGIAYGIPTVAIFGSTRPYLETTRDNARVIFNARNCAPCGRRPTCEGRFDCMQEITVDDVLREFDEASQC